MKIIKDIWGTIIDILDDMAVQLGLQPKPIPARVKKSNRKNK